MALTNPLDPGYYCSEELRSFGFARVGENVRIAKNCTVIGPENIEIGDHVRVDAFTTIIATGPVRLDSYIHIATGCLLGGRGGIIIGDYCALSHGVKLLTASDDFTGETMHTCEIPARYVRPTIAPIGLLGYNVVGAGSVILPDVVLSQGAAIGSLSLVRNSVPMWEIHAGSPATKRNDRKRSIMAISRSLWEDGRMVA